MIQRSLKYILAALLVWSVGVVCDLPWLVRASQLAAALAGISFAGLTLRLQGKRRRAKADATYRYWQMGLVSSILALLMLGTLAGSVYPKATLRAWPLLWLGSGLGAWWLGDAGLDIAGWPHVAAWLERISQLPGWQHPDELMAAEIPD